MAGFFLLQMKRDLTQSSPSKYMVHIAEKFRDEAGLRDCRELRRCHKIFFLHKAPCTHSLPFLFISCLCFPPPFEYWPHFLLYLISILLPLEAERLTSLGIVSLHFNDLRIKR